MGEQRSGGGGGGDIEPLSCPPAVSYRSVWDVWEAGRLVLRPGRSADTIGESTVAGPPKRPHGDTVSIRSGGRGRLRR